LRGEIRFWGLAFLLASGLACGSGVSIAPGLWDSGARDTGATDAGAPDAGEVPFDVAPPVEAAVDGSGGDAGVDATNADVVAHDAEQADVIDAGGDAATESPPFEAKTDAGGPNDSRDDGDLAGGDVVAPSDTGVDAGTEVDADASDAGVDAGTEIDADAASGDGMSEHATLVPCDVTKPFGIPVAVLGLNDVNHRRTNSRLSEDELTVYAAQLAPGADIDWDIYVGHRSTTSDPFTGFTRLDNIDTTSNDYDGSMSADGLNLVVESSRNGGFDAFLSTRGAVASPFPSPTLVDLGATGTNGGPYLVGGANVLYFHSFRNGSNDLYRAVRSGGAWVVTELSSLNTSADEAFPVVSLDELAIYFSSSRGGPSAAGSNDIWMATRTSRDQPFDPPVNLGDVNSALYESADWVSSDGCRLYYDRTDEVNLTSEVFVVERSR
jgi:hypothetical protein